jgi:hypothetical protein
MPVLPDRGDPPYHHGMICLRFVLCGLVALASGAVTFFGIGESGLAQVGDPTGPIYSNLVIYPAVMLMGCFGFYIVFAATDTGSEK